MTADRLRLIITADGGPLQRALAKSKGHLASFGRTAKAEFDRIRRAASSLQGMLAGIGVGIGASMLIKQSANLDKTLTQIGQTAGEGQAGVAGLRAELFRMAGETGQSVENLKQGFNNAVQAGLDFREALPVLDATNKAMAITGAQASVLTSGLTVARTAFDFDLTTADTAVTLLDKMIVAGRLGNAELENLSDIFARVGVNARTAGMDFDKTLAFIEGLSQIERQPERLATLADSTLRLFTNTKYLEKAQAATGVNFFGKSGARRDPVAVLKDLKAVYDSISTEKGKATFMGKAFEGVDLDTIRGLRTLFSGQNLAQIEWFIAKIAAASGTMKKDIDGALNNAEDQAGRLAAKMREAADAFIRPLNRGIAEGIKMMINHPEKGGLGLTGGQIAGGAAGGLALGYLAYRGGSSLARRYLGRLGGMGAGLAAGKVLESAAGVTPVFVTNWPAGGLVAGVPGIPARAGTGGATLAKGAALIAPPVAGAVAAYEFNKYASRPDVRKESMDRLALAMETDRRTRQATQNVINMNIAVDRNGRTTSYTNDPNTRINLKRGSFGTAAK